MIGAGNLATQLSKSLVSENIKFSQVYSRKKESASALAHQLNCEYTSEIKEIRSADLAILAVSDDALSKIEKYIHMPKVHTSGSTDINVLKGNSVGVFYPLQTFNKNIEADFSSIPICIESNNEKLKQLLTSLCKQLKSPFHYFNSNQRAQLHLAAVIACNFSNLMYQFSEEICDQNDIPFNLLLPLINKTADKITNTRPSVVQTGPAYRNDHITLSKHISMLTNNPEKKDIYKLLSDSIKNRHELQRKIK